MFLCGSKNHHNIGFFDTSVQFFGHRLLRRSIQGSVRYSTIASLPIAIGITQNTEQSEVERSLHSTVEHMASNKSR
jgi:hypothetical protein